MKKSLLLLCFVSLFIQAQAQQTVGLFLNDTNSFNGYTLFAPSSSTTTYLIDNCGFEINSWNSAYFPGIAAYFLENGHLIRAGRLSNSTFTGGGSGGLLQEFDWNGNLVWEYTYSNADHHQHHDFEVLPNGNILILAWHYKSAAEAIAEGIDPSTIGTQVWPDQIIEIEPIGTDSAIIEWEWSAWDHLIQDFDSTKNNFGVISDHPELIDINYHGVSLLSNGDWIHANSVDYNPDLDQIIISAHNFNEFWIIDHSTTTAEAASSTGGTYDKGGNLLYRWGNPDAYDRGAVADQKLFGQHDVHWIPNGLPDGGKIMLYNNGFNRPAGNISTIEIINPDMDVYGNYTDPGINAYGPQNAFWTYTAPIPTDFFSVRVSGVQRLPNGNTLICEGRKGNFFEINSSGTIVWNYESPVGFGGPVSQGSVPLSTDVFRAPRYAPTYPGFNGLTLTPGNPVELNPFPSTCTINSSSVSVQAFVANNVSCFGLSDGNASVTAIGGTSPHTFNWSNGSTGDALNNASSGLYIVTVSDNSGSTATASVTIYGPEPLNATIFTSGSTAYCPVPGVGVLLESVINPNVTKQWLKGGNPIAGATGDNYLAQNAAGFKLLVTDVNGCTNIGNTITTSKLPRPPSNITVTGNTTFCGGDSAVLQANTGPYTYQWLRYGRALAGKTNSFLVARKGGNYKVSVIDSLGCWRNSALTVLNKNQSPLAYVTPNTANLPSPICNGDSILLTANGIYGHPAYTYQWFRYTTLLVGETNSTYLSTNTGGYSVRLVDTRGCADKSKRTVINETCRIHSIDPALDDELLQIHVFPNPFSSILSIEFLNQINSSFELTIINSLGEIVYNKSYSEFFNRIEIPTGKLNPGIYLLNVTGSDFNYNRRIVKSH